MSSLIDFVQFHEVDLPARLRSGNARLAAHDAVSYTHLTLPTTYPVLLSVVAVPFKKKNTTTNTF